MDFKFLMNGKVRLRNRLNGRDNKSKRLTQSACGRIDDVPPSYVFSTLIPLRMPCPP